MEQIDGEIDVFIFGFSPMLDIELPFKNISLRLSYKRREFLNQHFTLFGSYKARCLHSLLHRLCTEPLRYVFQPEKFQGIPSSR